MDGLQMGREGTRESSTHRRMSFNPVSDWGPELHQKPSVVSTYTKEEVSKGKRICKASDNVQDSSTYSHQDTVQVAVAVTYCLFAAGVVFGYAAIKPVLIEEGVYRNQCTKKELEDGTSPCYGQEIRHVHYDTSEGSHR